MTNKITSGIRTSGPQQDYFELMLHRVYEILLVASPYDAFILEEDGRLTEQILSEYIGMSMRNAPRLWQSSTAGEALEQITRRKFDLVLVMMRISDMDPITFSTKVKEMYPQKPVILLLFDESELKQLPDVMPKKSIDRIFIYSGNADLFPAITKYVEDKKNVKRDVAKGDVRVIIVVEDNPRYYSLFLPLIYREILFHTKNLLSRSLSEINRIIQKRGRPKILLASNYEDARKYFTRYTHNVIGIISDIRFPRGGKIRDHAGIEFARWVRKRDPSMPYLLQSSEMSNKKLAEEASVGFLHKRSITFLQEMRAFILNNFGFGDFVFRSPSGEKVAVAANLVELQKVIKTVPVDSLIYHASSNHFSNWLAARGEFKVATTIRNQAFSDFEDPEDLRQVLINAIDSTVELHQQGKVIDFSDQYNLESAQFIRIGSGSLGGKARGLGFANTMIATSELQQHFPQVRIRIPRVSVIGTDEFDTFMSDNNLWDAGLSLMDNDMILRRFINGKLCKSLIRKLKILLENTHYPLAVRSSSLLEDAQYNPLAGAYTTLMLHNASPSLKHRMNQLQEAVKRIYASMFFHSTKSTIVASTHRFESEKMAVIIQELVGQQYENRFYPTFSGVTQSINYYPVSYMQRNEGVAYIALGMGRTIADGEKSLRFSPRYPGILPQYYSIRSILQNSQNQFYALNMDPASDPLAAGESGNLGIHDLNAAEIDGTLKFAGSVISDQDGVVRDALSYKGTRVITFASILKYNTFPLSEILTELLELGERSLGCPVELEFAVNIRSNPEKRSEFCLLQIKPLPTSSLEQAEELEHAAGDTIFCRTGVCLGNGNLTDIRNILYVDPEKFDSAHTIEIAKEIEEMNDLLGERNPYILIGPGRWGSADPWLGVPVTWNQISNVRVMVEAGMENFLVDPSFGSHFFQNVTSMRIGYFTINHKSNFDQLDWEWLNRQRVTKQTRHLKWVQLPYPVSIKMNGSSGKGVIVKPDAPEMELMDEEESTGI